MDKNHQGVDCVGEYGQVGANGLRGRCLAYAGLKQGFADPDRSPGQI